MTPRERFDKLLKEVLQTGELTLKTIMHNEEEVSSLKLIVKGRRWMIQEIVAINDGEISRHSRIISQRRAENYIWANLPPIQSSKEEEA